MAIFYRILLGIVIAALAVLLWFFIVGLGDGSVNGSNMLIWLIGLAVPIACLVIGMHLWKTEKHAAALVLLAVPAAPALFAGLFLLLFIIAAPDMR